MSELLATVSPITCLKAGSAISRASGFFYSLGASDLFFVTNRHVVIDEQEDYFPDSLRLRLHTDPKDLTRNRDYDLPLYVNGKSVWLEHPRGGANVDVIALRLDPGKVSQHHYVKSLALRNHVPNEIDLSIGEDVLVIGYPLGFHDELHNLPVVRSATLASAYPVPFGGRPFVLIDSRLHPGTSGSPVVTKPNQMVRYRDGSTAIKTRPVTYLVGVHSASIDVPSRDPVLEEPLGLNVVWFADLVREVASGEAG